ncbi:unnamed protein product [Rangifer tarandus platyrhynchus]|uniref:Collagen alpha-1(I) chain-like n=1 Tax=Rangifer tarandus platyrhynchus TaxID=3082113 RepID=A0ABN9A8J8_RANTA|nr:unnamed protein product [Rangifer tarandus platyrhynchus]
MEGKGGESVKTRRGGVRDEAERPPGAPSGRGCQEAPAGARPTPRSVITRVGARARGRLGCPVEMLLAGSPKPGNRIAPAAGPGLGGAIPAGSPLGDPGPLLFPANSFEIAQAWGEFASLFQRGSLSYTRFARPHKVPELALVGYLQMSREGSERRRAQRAHSTLPFGGGKLATGSVASGIRAASGSGCARTKREPPGGPARPGKPSWPAPLCLPSPVFDCPCPIPDTRRVPGCRHRPWSRAMRAALRSARPVREGGDHAQRQVGRVLGANFGVPRPSVTRGLRSSATQVTSGGHKCSSAPPEHSDLPRPPSALPCCGAPAAAAAAAAGAVPKGQAAAGAGSLASGARRAARLGRRSPPASGRCPPSPPAAGRFSSRPSSCRRRCSGSLSVLAPFPPPGSAPRARKVEFRGFKLLIGISHCCVTRGGGDTHAAHSHTLTLKATSGSGLKGEAALPRPRPRWTRSPETLSFGPARGRGQRKRGDRQRGLPGQTDPQPRPRPPLPRPGRALTFRGPLPGEERRSHGRRVGPPAPRCPAVTAVETRALRWRDYRTAPAPARDLEAPLPPGTPPPQLPPACGPCLGLSPACARAELYLGAFPEVSRRRSHARAPPRAQVSDSCSSIPVLGRARPNGGGEGAWPCQAVGKESTLAGPRWGCPGEGQRPGERIALW